MVGSMTKWACPELELIGYNLWITAFRKDEAAVISIRKIMFWGGRVCKKCMRYYLSL